MEEWRNSELVNLECGNFKGANGRVAENCREQKISVFSHRWKLGGLISILITSTFNLRWHKDGTRKGFLFVRQGSVVWKSCGAIWVAKSEENLEVGRFGSHEDSRSLNFENSEPNSSSRLKRKLAPSFQKFLKWPQNFSLSSTSDIFCCPSFSDWSQALLFSSSWKTRWEVARQPRSTRYSALFNWGPLILRYTQWLLQNSLEDTLWHMW